MLTKEDLEQLRAVVRDEIRSETAVMKRDVHGLQTALWSVKEDVKRLTGDMLVLKEDVQGVKQDIQGLKDGQARLEEKVGRIEHNQAQDAEVLGEISGRLMEVVDDHAARLKHLEDHTGLSHS